jgi:hypothetical protein
MVINLSDLLTALNSMVESFGPAIAVAAGIGLGCRIAMWILETTAGLVRSEKPTPIDVGPRIAQGLDGEWREIGDDVGTTAWPEDDDEVALIRDPGAICQKCGGPNLRAYGPCMYCGQPLNVN